MSPETPIPAELEALMEALSNRYAVEALLGRGSTATVWLARDLRHDRPVALKVLHDELGSAVGLERFQREIHLAAKLQHPHILPLFDSGAAAGRLWYAMPFVAAGSLRDRIERDGPLPAVEVAALGAQVADALNYAHEQGVIHRDLKPENIMLSSTGDGLLADFGIARAVEGSEDTVRLTETGIAVGTPLYMSPEQASGEGPIDGRTDVYALAGVLFEALTGTAPFPGESVREIIVRRLTEPPPSARKLRREVPAGLDTVLQRGLARRSEERFPTAAEFAAALRSGQAGRRIAGQSRRRLLVAAIGAVALAAGLGLLLRVLPARAPARPSAVPVLAVLPFKNLGPADDQYFADGVTEEITSRLAGLSGLAVISRTSADQYRDTRKTLREIGAELGVAYVLEGSVRWDRSTGGSAPGQVRVTPQLIRVGDDTYLWAASYDAELGEVFRLQTTIAEQVAVALDIALRPPEQAALAQGGTKDADAYDYYLRGNDYYNRGHDRVTLDAARGLYERAVARDPRFALAFARLANAHTYLYWFSHDPTSDRLALAKRAADSALALSPGLPEAQIALGYYHYLGFRDYARALEQFEAARRRQPANGDLLAGIAAVDRRRGHWDRAARGFSEALRYDPRSNVRAFELGYALAATHRFAEAEGAYDRAIALAPDWPSPYVDKASLYLAWTGDLVRARGVLAEAVRRIGFGQLAPWLASSDQITSTILTSDSASAPLVDALTLQGFAGDTVEYYFIKAESARFRRLAGAERAYAESLRTVLDQGLRAAPDNPDNLSWLGIAYAALGRKADAERAARRAVELMPVAKDALVGPYLVVARARVHMMLGEPERAIELLAPLLDIPSLITREALRADPLWAPLREHPRFRRLAATTSGP